MANRKALLFLISTLSQFPLSTVRFIAPVYAQSIGATPFVLGMMGASYGAVYILLATYFGRFSERFGYGRMAASGLLVYALVVLAYPLIRDPYMLIVVRGGEAVGMAMVWPAIEAYSQTLGESRMERSVMVYTLSWSAAASVAPYAGALLLSNIFTAIAVVSVVSISGALVGAVIGRAGSFSTVTEGRGINAVYDIIVPVFVFGFNYTIMTSFYPAYGNYIGLGIVGTGTASAVSGAMMMAAFVVSGLFLKGRIATVIGLLLQLPFVIVSAGGGLAVQTAVLSLVMFGDGLIYFNVLLNIISSVRSGVGMRTGIFESSIGLGSIIGPLAAGIPTPLGFSFPWVLTTSVSAALLAIYLLHGARYNFLKLLH
ncbi:MAG: MFS transporter [Nitrososphaerota archaeon]|jgi:MFS family permease|nr:MFS transporter [Nitrososphaerota archaeon]MDG6931408.1 MFS transporter [Nitrososphaerota archaeon]MDG6936794.1 MFS transporter [Nitrososphaerota archaeon]MDG6943650.1 MFS transporter [Nitrososphaerota archaeon]